MRRACSTQHRSSPTLAASAQDSVYFGALDCTWDAAAAGVRAADGALTLPLTQQPLEVACSAAGHLCVLTPGTIQIFAPKASGGFDVASARSIALPPPPEGGLQADDEDEVAELMNDD